MSEFLYHLAGDRAWLGIDFTQSPPLARICAWCPDKKQADKRADSLGVGATHTICPRCQAMYLNPHPVPPSPPTVAAR
jgi:hypothetical protein